MPPEEKSPSKDAEIMEPPPAGLGGELPAVAEPPKTDPLKELEARMEARFEKEIEKRDREIASLKSPAPGPIVAEKIDIYAKVGTKLWEDTPAALKDLAEDITKTVTTQLRAEYSAKQSETSFWDEFYRSNSSLKRDDDHWVAQAIINENYASWKDLPVKEVSQKLAKKVDERLANIAIRRGAKIDPKDASMNFEGANHPTTKAKVPEPSKIFSLSQMIKDKQAFRQQSMRERANGTRPRDDRGRYKE